MPLNTWMALKGGVRNIGFRTGMALSASLLLLLLFGGVFLLRSNVEARTAAEPPDIPAAKVVAASELSKDFELVAKVVEPAVVNINTEQVVHNTAAGLDDPFRGFFGKESPFGQFFQQMPKDMVQKSLGSGFIIDPNGYILTNNHVVEHASKIKVKLDDGRMMSAKVVGTDPQTDLAVLKIEASNLPTVRIADSGQIAVGDWVLAFGSPFGLQKTMTAGIISATGRVIGAGPYDNFLQTDAAINPGNSGGPLVNIRGEVVGINTMIESQSGGFQGIGFAIPSSTASDVYRQLISHGRVSRGWLGVRIQEITPAMAKALNLGDQHGALVADVDQGSPAAKAGLKEGDIVIEYNGKAVTSSRDLLFDVAGTASGSSSRITVLRDGQKLTFNVTVGERPEETAENSEGASSEKPAQLGITVENLTPDTARQMNLRSSDGVLVTEVKAGGPADEAALQPGDVIHEINHKPVHNTADLLAVTRTLRNGATVLLRVEREGQSLFLAVTLS